MKAKKWTLHYEWQNICQPWWRRSDLTLMSLMLTMPGRVKGTTLKIVKLNNPKLHSSPFHDPTSKPRRPTLNLALKDQMRLNQWNGQAFSFPVCGFTKWSLSLSLALSLSRSLSLSDCLTDGIHCVPLTFVYFWYSPTLYKFVWNVWNIKVLSTL
jgi:hypothetical protein